MRLPCTPLNLRGGGALRHPRNVRFNLAAWNLCASCLDGSYVGGQLRVHCAGRPACSANNRHPAGSLHVKLRLPLSHASQPLCHNETWHTL